MGLWGCENIGLLCRVWDFVAVRLFSFENLGRLRDKCLCCLCVQVLSSQIGNLVKIERECVCLCVLVCIVRGAFTQDATHVFIATEAAYSLPKHNRRPTAPNIVPHTRLGCPPHARWPEALWVTGDLLLHEQRRAT